METEQKTITNVYAALTVSLVMSFLPIMSAALLALVMFVGVWIAAYVLRGKHEHDSLTADHMTFIIRTIWIAGLMSLLTMSAATAYILAVYDPTMMMACAQNLPSTDMAAIEAAVRPCYDEFMRVNMPYLIKGAAIGIGPVVIYLAYRLTKGLSRALKGHRIGDVKSWF